MCLTSNHKDFNQWQSLGRKIFLVLYPGEFGYNTNIRILVFHDFTRFGIVGIRKSQKQSDDHLYINILGSLVVC